MTIKLSELRKYAAKAEAKNLLPTVEASVVLRLLEIAEAALMLDIDRNVTFAERFATLRKALEGVEP